MRIRPATDGDLDDLVRLRLAFIADIRGVDPTSFDPGFDEATRAFFVETARGDRIRSWLVEVDGTAVGLVSVLLDDRPPLPKRLLAREGFVINLYVAPDHRRHGLARELLSAAIDAGTELGLRGFVLVATEQGRPLYDATGFRPDPRILVLPTDGSGGNSSPTRPAQPSSGNTSPEG